MFVAFFEIYKMCTLLHRSNRKFCENSAKIFHKISEIWPGLSSISAFFVSIFINVDRNFTIFLESYEVDRELSTGTAMRWNLDKFSKILINFEKILKYSELILYELYTVAREAY